MIYWNSNRFVVSANTRKFILLMVRLRLWKVEINLRLPDIVPCWGTEWLFNWLLDQQTFDNFHHAPCCPANHFHKRRFVFERCNCGAQPKRSEIIERSSQ